MSPETPGHATLVVFCRRPAPGVGKQRLAAHAGTAFAFELSRHLLAAALEDAAGWPGPVALAPACAADHGWAAQLLERETLVVPQPEGNLGERLAAVDRELRARGHERLLYIGSDAPALDAPWYARARQALEGADVVLGPAADGGVTLMGARVPWPELTDLPWSTPALGDALEARCRKQGLSIVLLPRRCDVDDVASLAQLRTDLAGDARPARRALRHWLASQVLPVAEPLPVSVVVPVLDDTPALRRLLPALQSLRPPPEEIVVVDGRSDADCRALCHAHGALYLAAPQGRGRQLRAGAAAARHPLLWFLHADAEPPAAGIAAIREAVRGGAAGGWFRFRFAGHPGLPRRALAALINLRARIGTPYGDQGLFATRTAYEAAGGFADTPLFEEVPLVHSLRRQGRFVPLSATLGVSPRRWERDGWWRRTLENRALALAYMAGVSPQRLAARYRARRGAAQREG